MVWFVETDGGMTAVPGIWTRSAYAGAVANLGAVLSWASYTRSPAPTDQIWCSSVLVRSTRFDTLSKNEVMPRCRIPSSEPGEASPFGLGGMAAANASSSVNRSSSCGVRFGGTSENDHGHKLQNYRIGRTGRITAEG